MPYLQRHAHPVQVAGLVAERREHEHDVVAAEAERLRHRPEADVHRVVAVEHALRLAGRSGREHDLGRIAGSGPPGVELRRRMLVLPTGVTEERLEPLHPVGHRAAVGVADEDVLEGRQFAAEVPQHGGMVEAPELAGHDADAAGDPVEDEADLPAAQDGDDRVGHRPDPHAGEVEGGHLPPVRQLEADHLAPGHVELDQRTGEPIGQAGELAVAHDLRVAVGPGPSDTWWETIATLSGWCPAWPAKASQRVTGPRGS